jgi:hypothetical protein
MSDSTPEWITHGRGEAPELRWSFGCDAPLAALALAREAGEVLAADTAGGLYLLTRQGRIIALTRGLHSVEMIAWSDSGDGGFAVLGESAVCRLSRQLEVEWSLEFPDSVLAIAAAPYGGQVCVSLANGANHVFDARKSRVSSFETMRPLSFLQFVAVEPAIIGAAEYGLLCCHELGGGEIWNEKLWTNVGALSVTGDGRTILLAAFNHGIQSFDGDGTNRGSYIVDGTPSRVATSFVRKRLVASTVERHLYWLDADGEMLWAADVPEDVTGLACDPLGNWLVCGFASGHVVRLDWRV